MNSQSPLSQYDQVRNFDDINSAVSELAQYLTPTESDSLAFLLEQPISQWKKADKAYDYLAEICRLLLKKGDKKVARQVLDLSFKVYEIERMEGRDNGLSSLFKGVAEIALGFNFLGIKNILKAFEAGRTTLAPVDSCLANWGLLGAAVAQKNLELAQRFTSRWIQSAQGLEGELFRSHLALQVLYLLQGEKNRALENLEDLKNHQVPAFLSSLYFAEMWTTALVEGLSAAFPHLIQWPRKERHTGEYICAQSFFGTPLSPGTIKHSLILFLGEKANWLSIKTPGADSSEWNFRELCHFRRQSLNSSFFPSLTENRLGEICNFYARWELGRPHWEGERELKKRNPDLFFNSLMDRIQGKFGRDKIIGDRARYSKVTRREEALVWMMDVRRYSAISEELSPQELYRMLSPLFKIINEELEMAGGMIHEFVGDAIMVVFNAFEKQNSQREDILKQTSHCLGRIYFLSALSHQVNLPRIQIGVGINQGPVAIGYLGGLSRCQLSILGNTVNLAARLEGLTKRFPYPVALSENVFDDDSPQVWENPRKVNYSLRDFGKHQVRNITQPVQVYGFHSLIRYWVDFVPMGLAASPEENVVYLSIGGKALPGIIDKNAPDCAFESSCALINNHPELLLDHLEETGHTQIEFRLPQYPNLDCLATLYSAYEHLEGSPRVETLHRLSQYVTRIEQGYFPSPGEYQNSLYGLLRAHEELLKKEKPPTEFGLLQAGLRVIDAAVFLAEKKGPEADFASIFQDQPTWFARERELLERDRELFERDLEDSLTYQARVRGEDQPVEGLWLTLPESILFKVWARNFCPTPQGDGYLLMTVDWSEPEKDFSLFIISVNPAADANLKGLGEILEAAETKKRQELGLQRPPKPKRYPGENADPWYFGQGHDYTLVMSPSKGTVLSAGEIRRIQEEWNPEKDPLGQLAEMNWRDE